MAEVVLLWPIWAQIFLLCCFELEVNSMLYRIDPRENIWVTWANQTGQEDFCLSMATPGDPFRTCLIGYPIFEFDDFNGFIDETFANWNKTYEQEKARARKRGDCMWSNEASVQTSAFLQRWIIEHLNKTSSLFLQELDLLGSVAPARWENVSTYINCSNSTWLPWKGTSVVYLGELNAYGLAKRNNLKHLNLSSASRYWNFSIKTTGIDLATTTGGKVLPPGYFLICGNRAWEGIPHYPMGGPCYIGKLTMFTPRIRDLWNATTTVRQKRELKNFGPDCDDDVNFGTISQTVALSFFVPGAAAARNWNKLKHLACWSLKQFNTTSNILSQLLTDVNDVRHALLQNRAAIDFLLLAQGHGCQEFESMGCMNLSDHSQSIHKQLSTLQERLTHITYGTSPLSNWFASLSLTGWISELLKQGLVILIAVVIMLTIFRCLISCIRKTLEKVVAQAWIVQKEKGGNVENMLSDIGSEILIQACLHNPAYVLGNKDSDLAYVLGNRGDVSMSNEYVKDSNK